MPGMQAACHRGHPGRARADPRASTGVSRRPDPREEHHRGRVRESEATGRRDDARRARGDGAGLHMTNGIAAKVYGEPVIELPHDLYIPPDALEVVLEAFE